MADTKSAARTSNPINPTARLRADSISSMGIKLSGLSSGAPAWIDPENRPGGSYFGYFAGECGDDWVLMVTSKEILISGSDIDWEVNRLSLDSAQFADFTRHSVLALINNIGAYFNLALNEDERLWLTGALRASLSIIRIKK